jgi:hypothetical protein
MTMTTEPATSMNDIESTPSRVLLEWWSTPERYAPQTVRPSKFRHEVWRELAARCRHRKECRRHEWKFARVTVVVGKPLAAFR